VNGTQQALTIPTYNQNADTYVNSTHEHRIGYLINQNSSTYYLDSYLADAYLIDGQQLTPSAFGEFDTNGVWQPIDASGLTYGTNGFHLPFSDNSTAAALGTDTSGNGNDWTPNNFAVLDGNGNYLQGWTASSGFYSPYLISRGFDGIYGPTLNEMALTLGTSMTWAPSTSVSTGSSFRIFTYPAGGYNSGYIVTVGAVSQTVATSPTLGEWMNLTSLTGLTINTSTPLVITTNGGSRAGFSAIEINGVILLDNGVVGPTNDSLVDSPTNGSQVDTGAGGEVVGNYATLNPLDKGTSQTLSNGNLDPTTASTIDNNCPSTIGVSSGKWYFELTINNIGTTGGGEYAIGLGKDLARNIVIGDNATSWAYASNGNIRTSSANSSYGSSYTTGDVLGAAFDADNGTLTFYKNGISQGTAATGISSGPYFFLVGTYGDTSSRSANFGQRPFAYTAPSGFKALCTTNLPEPTIADGSTVMDVALYTGNGSTQTISGLNFSPDLVWIKSRSLGESHLSN
jgi:hypothetical protein